jgi:AcrR family transcriptional regulator
MARPKAADYDEHRARILQRAVDAFARSGYPSASMAGLAQECGASKAALYHYFPSKDALLFEALDAYTRRLLVLVEAEQARALSPRDELAAIVRALMAEYSSSHAYHAALLGDVRFLAEDERRRVRAQERAVVDAIASTLERAFPAAIGEGNRVVVTMALLGMINFTFAWVRPDGPVDHEQFAELVIDLWSNGLAGARTPLLQGQTREQAVRLER